MKKYTLFFLMVYTLCAPISIFAGERESLFWLAYGVGEPLIPVGINSNRGEYAAEFGSVGKLLSAFDNISVSGGEQADTDRLTLLNKVRECAAYLYAYGQTEDLAEPITRFGTKTFLQLITGDRSVDRFQKNSAEAVSELIIRGGKQMWRSMSAKSDYQRCHKDLLKISDIAIRRADYVHRGAYSFGIGVTLKSDGNIHQFDKIEENSPAYAAGLRKGDIITAVDENWRAGGSKDRLLAALRGSGGTVNVRFERTDSDTGMSKTYMATVKREKWLNVPVMAVRLYSRFGGIFSREEVDLKNISEQTLHNVILRVQPLQSGYGYPHFHYMKEWAAGATYRAQYLSNEEFIADEANADSDSVNFEIWSDEFKSAINYQYDGDDRESDIDRWTSDNRYKIRVLPYENAGVLTSEKHRGVEFIYLNGLHSIPVSEINVTMYRGGMPLTLTWTGNWTLYRDSETLLASSSRLPLRDQRFNPYFDESTKICFRFTRSRQIRCLQSQ